MKKWKIGWGPIARCNMKCQFCYSEKTRSEVTELELEDWIKFIDENHQFIDSINYGTGENTIDEKWFYLVKYIRENYPNIIQALTTNGYLSSQVNTNPNLKEIIVKGIDEIDVSLDFCIEDCHNDFRGQSKAYRWVLDTLQFCKDYNLMPTIVFLATNETLKEENIKGIFEIASQYDAKVRMNLYRPTNGINDFSKRFIPDFSNIVNALYFIEKHYQILKICDPLFSTLLTNETTIDDPSGINSLRILADGSITPSTYLISKEFRKLNIKESNVLEKLTELNGFNHFNMQTPNDCKDCNLADNCKGGVFDRRYLWYKTFDSKDPYCPYHKENFMPDKKVIITALDENQSVHDGYLPTMFFKN
jgi:radical SAM protein with 4Fe4S-binding SPASM domain